jgi:demethylmenaquinone methyltransferase / 2-methoxy-6-polyprenyl-1,4-benzoquinol methylase
MNADGSGAMFDRIAHRYDRLNRIMSVGLDQGWRRRLVESLNVQSGRVLDLATGTADVAIAVAERYADVAVVGVDPSSAMLSVGDTKANEKALGDRVTLQQGDAQALPFPDNHFAASCISFGIRNVPDRRKGLAEMARVTAPGGVVAVLELNEPQRGWLAPFARLHVRHIVPRLGAWLSGEKEYRYLQESIAAFPEPAAFVAMMEDAGLVVQKPQALGLGAAHLFVGRVQA